MKSLLTLLILLLGFRTAGAQSSVILDKVVNVREVVSGSSREMYSDLIQYRYYQNGTLTQTQRINSATYHWNGGGYGSAATRTFYSNMVSFLRWQENSYTLWASQRPAWLPVSASKTKPSGYDSGILHYKVAVSGGGDAGGGGIRLVDSRLLTDVVWAVLRSGGRLDSFEWTSLRRLTGNQIRSLYRTLGNQAAAALGNNSLQSEFTALGEEMALLMEQQSVNMTPAAQSLRDRAKFARERSARIADIYTRMFDSAVRPGMLNQLSQYSRDYELTLRRVEGNWTTNTPTWSRTVNGRPVFNDLTGANGNKLEYDDSAFPRVFVPALGKWYVIERDENADSQIFVEESTGKRFRMMVLRNSASVRTGTSFELETLAPQPRGARYLVGGWVLRWLTSVNPFR